MCLFVCVYIGGDGLLKVSIFNMYLSLDLHVDLASLVSLDLPVPVHNTCMRIIHAQYDVQTDGLCNCTK